MMQMVETAASRRKEGREGGNEGGRGRCPPMGPRTHLFPHQEKEGGREGWGDVPGVVWRDVISPLDLIHAQVLLRLLQRPQLLNVHTLIRRYLDGDTTDGFKS